MRNKLYLLTILVSIAALLSGCAGAAVAQSLNQTAGDLPAEKVTRTIYVTGTGKVYLTPDIAYVSIGVHTENKDATKAVADNNTKSQAVKDALVTLGIEAKDIQTTNFSIYPQQQYDQQGKPTGDINYVVDNSIYVTVRDITKVGEVLDASVKAGANSINGIQFDVVDRSKALSDARKLAVADAQAQAEELAQAAGVTLGAVQTINTSGGSTPVPMYEKAYGGGVAMAAAPSVPISPGQMTLQTDVNMVFEIR
jgi:uncharacterized protein YggE